MTTTDHQHAARQLIENLTTRVPLGRVELNVAALYNAVHRLAEIVASIPATTPADQPADVRGADHAREGGRDHRPRFSRETGAQRFKEGDRVCAVRGGLTGVTGTVQLVDGDGGLLVNNTEGTTVGWLDADDLELYDRPDPTAPAGEPVEAAQVTVLPTTPGSVAWTRDGGVFALTDDDDVAPWYALAGPRRRNRLDLRLSGYLLAGELLALDVVRVRNAGGGA